MPSRQRIHSQTIVESIELRHPESGETVRCRIERVVVRTLGGNSRTVYEQITSVDQRLRFRRRPDGTFQELRGGPLYSLVRPPDHQGQGRGQGSR